MKKRFILPLLFGTLIAAPLAKAAISVNLAYLALSQQVMPNSKGDTFTQFTAPHLSMGYTLFYGSGQLGSFGVFTNYYGYLRAIATNTTPIPLSTSNFTSFSNLSDFNGLSPSFNQSILNSNMTFIATDQNWETAIYNVQNNTVTLIANQNTPIPKGQSTFSGFAYPTALSNNAVAFWASGSNNQEGIYQTDSKGHLSVLINTSTLIPNKISTFQHFLYPAFSRDSTAQTNIFAFVGVDNQNKKGIYLYNKGKINIIVDQSTTIPNGGVGYFTDFRDLSFDATTNSLAFVADGILGQTGLYFYNGSSIVSLALPNSLLPDGVGQFTHFQSPCVVGKNTVFAATGSHNLQGIYFASSDGSLYKVVSNHDVINKKNIQNIEISHEGFSNNQVALLVHFTDGSSGIYIGVIKGIAY